MQPDTSEALTAHQDDRSKGMRITSRVVIALVALWFLGLYVFGLLELFLMWLPTETLAEMFDESQPSEMAMHRTHFLAIGVLAWSVVLSMLVQLRKPERRLAPMLLLVGAAIVGTVLFALSGTVGEWLMEEIAFVLVPVGLVVLVHPARDQLFTKPNFDRTMAGMAGLAAVPWLVFVLDNAWNQFQNVAGDTHAEMEHWGIAALMGSVIALAAILGASDKAGWRLTGWIAALGSVVFGVHSLVFPGLASALPTLWGVAAVIWGIGYGAMIIRRSREGANALAAT